MPRSARKPRGEGASRRGEILEAAERLFVEVGYEGATIRRIADEVGLSSTALYMHFADKGEILHEICRAAFEELLASNRAILLEPIAPCARLRRMLEAYVDFGFAHPNAYRLIYLTRPVEAEGVQRVATDALGADLFASFSEAVSGVARSGRLKQPPEVAGRILWAGVHGVVSLMITKPYFDWQEPRALTQTMIDVLIAGLVEP